MVDGGAALARGPDGRVVFVSGALPDETVTVRFRTMKKDFATADVVRVVAGSPLRTVPACEAWHRGCGGCDWQHIDPGAQLALKVDMVREALSRTARLSQPVVVAGATVAPWAYRTTIRVAVDPSGAVGFRSRRSHDLVLITSCPVAHPRINSMLAAISAEGTHELTLRVGLANDENLAWGDVGAVIAGLPAGAAIGAELIVHELVGRRRFRVSGTSFFQSSPEAAELLVDAVARATADLDMAGSTVVDAYGGVGLFAATVALNAARVLLIEASASACADARHNLSHQMARSRAEVIECRVEDWQPSAADIVIADPARGGLDKVGAARIVATGAPRIVLVSCDAGSLARDTRLLCDHGYLHYGTEVIDVFPNTSHIETVTRFDRLEVSAQAPEVSLA